MPKMQSVRDFAPVTRLNGKPSLPLMTREPLTENKTADPSSSSPRGERYPIPSFFEYRIKARAFDPL